MTRPQVVLICPEPIRPVQQGVGIRFREMARELARDYRVSLWAPEVDPEVVVPGVELRSFPDRDHDVAAIVQGARAVVVHGHIADRYFAALDATGLGDGAAPPCVVDLYDPFLVEHLQYTRELGDGIYARDLDVLLRQLAAGDLFLVSSERQRLFYAGMMMAAGLFDPATYREDPTLQRLFAIAPFGVNVNVDVNVNAGAAPADADADGRVCGWRGVVPGIGSRDRIVFFGGIYDWYDPHLLLDVAEQLQHDAPDLRFLFSAHPNPQSTPQGVYARALARAEACGLADRTVFFVPWFPYYQRDAWLRQVDIAVCLHRPSLEADLSLRTRVLDFMHAGLPVIATDGGETATMLRESGGGVLVPPGDAVALRAAILSLLGDDDRRRAIGVAGRAWIARERPWSRTLDPLRQFCADPESPRRPGRPRAGSSPAPHRGRRGSSSPDFTVIVPTHNRQALLAEVLAALEAQVDAPTFETIVVDDGSVDGTRGWLEGRRDLGEAVRVITQRNRGAAAARNAGMRAARGRFVAFLGDDTVPDTRWLASHAACHEAAGCHPQLAVVGHVVWHARVRVTPFLRYINEQGKQFGFALIEDAHDLPFNFFYTSNASMHRETAVSELFDEGFPYAAWEDTEFAYRLTRRGMRIHYQATARVAHDHPTSIGRFMQRQERVGYSAVIFHARHPELGQWLGLSPEGPPPLPATWRERWTQARVRALDRLGVSSPSEWEEILRLAYLGGLHRGWRELRHGGAG